MRYVNKDVRVLLREARKQGCVVSPTKGGHLRVERNGQTIVVASTASDHRALANARAELRKMGVRL